MYSKDTIFHLVWQGSVTLTGDIRIRGGTLEIHGDPEHIIPHRTPVALPSQVWVLPSFEIWFPISPVMFLLESWSELWEAAFCPVIACLISPSLTTRVPRPATMWTCEPGCDFHLKPIRLGTLGSKAWSECVNHEGNPKSKVRNGSIRTGLAARDILEWRCYRSICSSIYPRFLHADCCLIIKSHSRMMEYSEN